MKLKYLIFIILLTLPACTTASHTPYLDCGNLDWTIENICQYEV